MKARCVGYSKSPHAVHIIALVVSGALTVLQPVWAQSEMPTPEDFEFQSEPNPDNEINPDQMLTTPMEQDNQGTPPPQARPETRPNRPAPKRNPTAPSLEPGEIMIGPNDPKNAEQMAKKKALVNLDFIEGQIQDIVRYIADQTNKNFIINEQVARGTVTILSPRPLTQDEAYNAFLSALEVRGLTTVKVGKFIKIIRTSDSRRSPIPIYTKDGPSNDAFVTRIVQLKYINAREMSRVVKDMLSRDGDVTEHPQTNSLIITDSAANIQKILRLLNILDIKGFESSIEIIRIKNASAEDIARKVSELYPPQSAGSINPATGSPSSGGDFQGQEKIMKIISDERTNSLIVLANKQGIRAVRAFVNSIDTPLEGTTGQIHVYHLKNVKAEDISNTLAALVAGKPGDRRRGPAFAPPPGQPPVGSSKQLSAEFSDEVKITADPTTNSLVIIASPRDFATIRDVIDKLDIRRKQVFVESIIMEVSIAKGIQAGTHFQGGLWRPGWDSLRSTDSGNAPSLMFGSMGTGGMADTDVFKNMVLNPLALAGAALGFRSGRAATITGPDGKPVNVPLISALLQLAASNSNFNIVSTPHILATANEAATISVGQNTPVRGAISQGTTSTMQSYETKKIATELKITPQISEGDYLSLEVEQNIEQIKSDNYLNTQAPQTTIRSAKTTMIIKDHQTAVLGGLMQTNERVDISKVPLLGDIPIIGWLFKSKHKTDERTNLLLFLTPHIIRDIGDMQDAFYQKVKERIDFLEEVGAADEGKKYYHLSDEQRKQLDHEIINQLENAPVEKLETVKPGENVEQKLRDRNREQLDKKHKEADINTPSNDVIPNIPEGEPPSVDEVKPEPEPSKTPEIQEAPTEEVPSIDESAPEEPMAPNSL